MEELFEAREFSYTEAYSIKYRIYVPSSYDGTKAYPLLLFLHGAGERGDDNISQLKLGITQPFQNEASPIYDCIVVAPQCPDGEKWVNVVNWNDCSYSTDDINESVALAAAVELLYAVRTEYAVDSDRIYAMGLSMGGYATWDLLVRHGDMLAAAVPICGGCDVSKAELLTDIPIRTYHGLLDTTVPPTGTLAMVEAIQKAGGSKIDLTEYSNQNHSIWDIAMSEDGLFEWLTSQKRSDRA